MFALPYLDDQQTIYHHRLRKRTFCIEPHPASAHRCMRRFYFRLQRLVRSSNLLLPLSQYPFCSSLRRRIPSTRLKYRSLQTLLPYFPAHPAYQKAFVTHRTVSLNISLPYTSGVPSVLLALLTMISLSISFPLSSSLSPVLSLNIRSICSSVLWAVSGTNR
jgi:hypothetical protein